MGMERAHAPSLNTSAHTAGIEINHRMLSLTIYKLKYTTKIIDYYQSSLGVTYDQPPECSMAIPAPTSTDVPRFHTVGFDLGRDVQLTWFSWFIPQIGPATFPQKHECELIEVQCVPHEWITGALPGARQGCLRVKSSAWSSLQLCSMLLSTVRSSGSQIVGSPGMRVSLVNQLQSGTRLSMPTHFTVPPVVRLPPLRDGGCVIQPWLATSLAMRTSDAAATRAAMGGDIVVLSVYVQVQEIRLLTSYHVLFCSGSTLGDFDVLAMVRRIAVEEKYTETYFNNVSRVVSFFPRRCALANCVCSSVRVNVYFTTGTVSCDCTWAIV